MQWTEQDQATLSSLNELVKAHGYEGPRRDDDDDSGDDDGGDDDGIALAVLTDVGEVATAATAAAVPATLDAALDRSGWAWVHVHDLRCLPRVAARVGMHEACVPVVSSDRSCQSTQLDTRDGVLYSVCFFRLVNETNSSSGIMINSSSSGSADSRDTVGADRPQACSMVKLFVYVAHGVLVTCEMETAQPQLLPPPPMTMAAPSSSSRRGAVADVAASEVEMRPLGAAGATEADLETEGRFAPPGGAVAALADRVLRCCRHKGGGSSGHNDRYSRYGLGLAVVELFEEALRLQAPLAALSLRGIAHYQRQLAALAATHSTAADVLMHLKVRALEGALVLLRRQVREALLLLLRVAGPDHDLDVAGGGEEDDVGGDGHAPPSTPVAEGRKGAGGAPQPLSAEGGWRVHRRSDASASDANLYPRRSPRGRGRAYGFLCQGPRGPELVPFVSVACDAHRLALVALDHALADAASCHADMNAVTELKAARTQVVLSLFATVFLPMTFLTGYAGRVCCQHVPLASLPSRPLPPPLQVLRDELPAGRRLQHRPAKRPPRPPALRRHVRGHRGPHARVLRLQRLHRAARHLGGAAQRALPSGTGFRPVEEAWRAGGLGGAAPCLGDCGLGGKPLLARCSWQHGQQRQRWWR